jgi:predicted nucleic acid-binding protein
VSRIFWDSNLFIYLFEGRGARADRVSELRARMLERQDQLFTSALTLGEVLVKPLDSGNEALAAQYKEAIAGTATILSFDAAAAAIYARVRRDRAIRAPDAIQLACASTAEIDLFVTNDDRLARKSVPGVQFIASLERAFV